MSEMIPARRVIDLLVKGAEDRGFRVRRFASGIFTMCCQCYQAQPERLQGPFGREMPWETVVRNEREGRVTIRLPLHRVDGFLTAEDAVASLSVTAVCHDEDNALCGWYLRDDLAAAIRHAIATENDQWADEWDAEVRRHEEARAREETIAAMLSAASTLTPAQRVQVVASVLKSEGKPVTVEQSRVSWQCDDITEAYENQRAGDFLSLVVVVTSSGWPVRADESCRLHDEADVLPGLEALRAEYERVAAMSPEERAAYSPVPAAKPRRGGPPWARGGGASKPKAPPKPEVTPESTRAWYSERGIDIRKGIRALEDLGKEAAGPGGVHPSRGAIKRMKDAYPDG